jgi:ribosomal protein L11 methyltransferase
VRMRAGLNWLEFSVATNGETTEAVVELFNRYVRGGAVVELPVDCLEHELPPASPPPNEIFVKTYLPLDDAAQETRQRLEEGLWHLGQILPIAQPVVRVLAEEDWATAWKQQYHLIRAGQRTVIVPAWETYDPAPDEAVIRLEPGMAFGTGLHPTTRLCLESLEKNLTPGCAVLDVGTGSGILAIAAIKLGARSALALDTDAVAVGVAQENAALNGVASQLSVWHGSLPGGAPQRWGETPENLAGGSYYLEPGRFDLVLVNILAPVIIAMTPALAARLEPDGWLIAAGLIEHQENEVVAALHAGGLQILERTQEQDWVCLVAQGQ